MTLNTRRVASRVVAVAVVALIADQFTKQWALANLAHGEVIPLLSTFQLRLAFNPGAAFGMGAEAGPIMAWAILLILTGLTAWIAVRVSRGLDPRETYLLALVAGGGWGNMVDRILRSTDLPLSGSVVDFLAWDNFAIFNIGDVFAVGGIIAWALYRLTRLPRLQPAKSQG
ncbi:MAG: hypothetical protein BGO97_10625 [Micrococcales bacterium 70-64]|nr:signal peptidase II [Leifsonia sp.]ODU64438.1 MAG: hypothetical protein ABT06_10630 [Leifsonia sp. SCN 70-46]OJX86129.1 MAG: hypothetical protein BGO97_10625 [Micrococcales bacterium 70-64]